MSAPSRAGAVCLVLGPLAGLVSMFVVRTVSLKAADQVAAFTTHPGLTRLGLSINTIAALLLIAGLVWLAATTYERSPKLAIVGGITGVLGMVAIMFDNAFHIAGSLMVSGLDSDRATAQFHQVISGGAMAVGPLSELADLGVIMLAIAALKIGVPRWAAALLIAGVIVQGVGFAAGARFIAAVGFAATFAGFALVVRSASGIRFPAPSPAATAVQRA